MIHINNWFKGFLEYIHLKKEDNTYVVSPNDYVIIIKNDAGANKEDTLLQINQLTDAIVSTFTEKSATFDTIFVNKALILKDLPTEDDSLKIGDVWNNNGVLNIKG